jgi:V/A-type H+/Na+-transporting ATPase subunit F
VTFFCIGDADTVAGFSLAGIPTRQADDKEQARTALEEALSSGDCAIVMITEALADVVRPELESIRFGRERPLVVEIPGPEGPLPGGNSITEFVQEALGMRIS